MRHWNCSDSVALFVYLLDFGMFRQCNIFLFFHVTLDLFRQYGIICFSMGFGAFPRVWHYWFFIFILDFATDSVSIIWFSMGLWNYSDSVALSVYLLDFGTDQTVWHDWIFYGTLELY